MKKIVLFAFNGEFMCFIHVLLNALDMKARGHDVSVVIEGAATKVIPEISQPGNPMHRMYKEAKEKGLIAGACKACSNKMGVLDTVKAERIDLLDDMSGHPSMAAYLDQGYEIITF